MYLVGTIMIVAEKEMQEQVTCVQVCSNCHRYKRGEGNWHEIKVLTFFGENTTSISHGLCDECAKELYPLLLQRLKLSSLKSFHISPAGDRSRLFPFANKHLQY
jgi:hypothetical protein